MCSRTPPKVFPPDAPMGTSGNTTTPATVFAGGLPPALTDASTGGQLKMPNAPAGLPAPGQPIKKKPNPYQDLLSRWGT